MKDADELGKAVKEVLPALRDLDDDALLGEIYDELYPEGVDAVEFEPDHLSKLIDRSRHHRGRWHENWFGKGRSENRAEWNTQLLQELQVTTALEESNYARKRQPTLHRQQEAETHAGHQVNLRIAQYAAGLADQGYTLETDQQMKLERHKAETEVFKTEQVHYLEEEHKGKLNILELDKDRQSARDQIEANFIIKYFSDHQRIAMLQTQLDQLYVEMDLLQRQRPPGWKYKLEDRKETVKTLKENQNALRTRLLETDQPKALAGASAESNDPRDPR